MKRFALLLSAFFCVFCIGCGGQPARTPQEKELSERIAQLRRERTARLHRKAANVRTRFIASALRDHGPLANPAHFVPALMEMLRDSDPQVRRAAVRALGNIGPYAKPAIPVLTRLLQDQFLHEAAAEALEKIQTSPS